MTGVRTRDEAISAVDHAVRVWSDSMTGVLVQASARVNGLESNSDRVVRRLAAQVAALESRVSSAAADDRARLSAELAAARARHDRARQATARIATVAATVAQLANAHTRNGAETAAAARGQLAQMSSALAGYRQGGGFAGASGGSTPSTAAAAGNTTKLSNGLSNISVQAADLDDNPIVGTFGRSGHSRGDYRWAVQTWNDVVSPGIAAGMTRDDFAARDTQRDARPLRRSADVYDLFLGSERIRVDRRPDGSLDIINGRHRLHVARELGIAHLPGEVSHD